MLTDAFGRELRGLRVSLTDRCNFDCVYCHNEGLGDTRGPMEPRDHELTADEVVRILEVATEFGVEAVKFTGGEPMLRDDLEEIVRRTPAALETSLTTNGTFLPGRAMALADAGLERVNVSQDAMDPDTFAAVTKSGAFERVLEGVDAAIDAGLTPVKLNMVVFEQTATHIPEMVDRIAEADGLQLQLIEYMPELTGNADWGVDVGAIHEDLEARADHVEHREMHHRRRYYIGNGMVEIVDPVGNPQFCANCHRVRVTHDAKLKGCLNRTDDLVSMGTITKPEIREAFRTTVAARVPYYGAYLVRNEDGDWVRNEEYDEDGDLVRNEEYVQS